MNEQGMNISISIDFDHNHALIFSSDNKTQRSFS